MAEFPSENSEAEVWALAQEAATYGQMPELPEDSPRERLIQHFRAANLLAIARMLDEAGIQTPLSFKVRGGTELKAEDDINRLGERLSRKRRERHGRRAG